MTLMKEMMLNLNSANRPVEQYEIQRTRMQSYDK